MTVTDIGTSLHPSDPASRDLQRLKEATGKVVGSVFLGALLKSMDESRLKGTYGHGGRGEEVFGRQLHGILAERVGTASHGGLKDILFRHLAPQQQRINKQSPQGSAFAEAMR